MAKQDDFVRYTIRVPSALYSKLQSAAGVKSVNAEIVERLQRTFEQDARALLQDRFREIDETGTSRPRPPDAPLKYPPAAGEPERIATAGRIQLPKDLTDDEMVDLFTAAANRAMHEVIQAIVDRGGSVKSLSQATETSTEPDE